jgi:hypothetical protein
MDLKPLDKLILDLLCLDNPLKNIPILIQEPKTNVNKRMVVLKEMFGVSTMQGLIFKYSKSEEE